MIAPLTIVTREEVSYREEDEEAQDLLRELHFGRLSGRILFHTDAAETIMDTYAG